MSNLTRTFRRSLAWTIATVALAWSAAALAEDRRREGEPAAPGARAPTGQADVQPPFPGPTASTPPEPGPPVPVVPPVPPPAVPVPSIAPPPQPGDVFGGKRPDPDAMPPEEEEHSWFDASHDFVGRLFFAPTVRFDRFFSDETDLDPERAQSFARLRTSLRLRQDGKPERGLDLVADIKLPGFNRWLDNRVRLILTGQSDTTEDALNPDGTTSRFTSRERGTPNLELRFGAYKGIRASVDLGAGVLFRLPPGAFSRVRYRLAIPVDELFLLRFATQAFWRTDMHLGGRASAELDWPLAPSSQLQMGVASLVAQRRTRGIEYGTELGISHAFSPTFAVALGTDAQGSVRDPVLFQRYRIYSRFRHDVLRRWLFVELEPEVAWPWTPQRGRYRAFAVMLRLEIQFEGGGAVEAMARARRAELP